MSAQDLKKIKKDGASSLAFSNTAKPNLNNLGAGKIELPSFALNALKTLNESSEEAYVVGGFIRDALLGIVNPAADVDIATSALPEQTEKIFQAAGFQTIPTGIKHGTITVLIPDDSSEERLKIQLKSNIHAVEITTFRTEGSYADNRHPDHVSFEATLEEDLSRRDFAINALAYHPKTGLLDPFDGIRDLQTKTVRAIGEPKKRFQEDALRVLRAVRFACLLGFSIEKNTWEAAKASKTLLEKVAAERLGAEMQKMVRAPYLSLALTCYKEILFQVLPELSTLDGYEQDTPYHCFDVLTHVARVIDFVQVFAGVDTSTETNKIPESLGWAALLHDIGKPAVMFRDAQTNQMHFYGHPQKGVDIARPILKRFGVNKQIREEALALVRLHDRPVGSSREDFIHLLTALSQYCSQDAPRLLYPLSLLREADAASKARAYRTHASDVEKIYVSHKRLFQAEKIPLTANDLALSGDAVLQYFQMESGPWVGEILQELLSIVQKGRIENFPEALKQALPEALYARNRALLKASLVSQEIPEIRKIGLELERFVISNDTGERLTYKTGVQKILARWIEDAPFKPIRIFEEQKLIGCVGFLKGTLYSVTLEPGSQLEVSLGPAASVAELQQALEAFDSMFAHVTKELGLNASLVATGTDACHSANDIALLAKPRYRYMNEYLSKKGRMAKDMMRRSASTQISIDSLDPEAFSKEYQLACAVSELLYFLCNNTQPPAPFMERALIWENVDAKRCGVVPGTFEKNFSVETYLDWVLACPAIFVPLDTGEYLQAGEEAIGALLSKRVYSEKELLFFGSIVFPDVRLKGFLELRTADAMEPKYALSLAAFLEGIFYNEQAFEKAYELLVKPQIADGPRKPSEPPFKPTSWDDDFYGKPFSEIVQKLMEISYQGLTKNPSNNPDKQFLAPFFDLWSEKKLLSDL